MEEESNLHQNGKWTIYLKISSWYDQTSDCNLVFQVHYQILFLHLLEQLTYGCNYPKLHLLVVIPISFFVTNAYLNYDHEDKIDEFFRLMKEEEAPKKYKFPS